MSLLLIYLPCFISHFLDILEDTAEGSLCLGQHDLAHGPVEVRVLPLHVDGEVHHGDLGHRGVHHDPVQLAPPGGHTVIVDILCRYYIDNPNLHGG